MNEDTHDAPFVIRTEKPDTLLMTTPGREITFMDTDGHTLGILRLSGDKIGFEGDADASAKVFFDAVVRHALNT